MKKIYVITLSSEFGDEFEIVRSFRNIVDAQKYLLTHTDMELHIVELY